MKFIIATNNAKKLVELERILNPLGIEAVSAKEAGVDCVKLEGFTDAAVSRVKAITEAGMLVKIRIMVAIR